MNTQAPAQSRGSLLSYLSGWATLAYLALARRLRLRAHLLLVMPELCMQATACMAGFVGRQDFLERALSGSHPAQVRAVPLSCMSVLPVSKAVALCRAGYMLKV